MIGIVVVSHSPDLANAAVALALEMAGSSPPRIAVAAGAGEGVTGTDAVQVAAAIDEVSSPDGVLVFMDLGSAVLSARMALEFTESTAEVRLSGAPFVEGIVAGVVLAAAGASLDEADREVASAMNAKNAALAPPGEPPPAASAPPTEPVEGGSSAEVTLVNPLGVHARPAATIVSTMERFQASVTITNLAAPERPASARSLMAMMALGAQGGDRIRIEATGSDATEAVRTLREMAEEGFGELTG